MSEQERRAAAVVKAAVDACTRAGNLPPFAQSPGLSHELFAAVRQYLGVEDPQVCPRCRCSVVVVGDVCTAAFGHDQTRDS